MNLVLEAERTVYTKSGRECVQSLKVDLWQTPTSLTYDVIALNTFEEQLDAYCEWADSKEALVEEAEGEWEEIYDYEVGPREKYFNIDNEHWPDRSMEQYVEKVVLKGDPEFNAIYSQVGDNFSFIYEVEKDGYIGVGYRKVKYLPHSGQIKKKVEMLKEDEYELSFSMI